jgi:Ca2+-transporting ATPase
MGQRGTDAAKQVSDMILKNDDFSTILKAVEQGRVIFGNIRKSVIFMLCTNLSEIIAVGVAAALNTPLPLLPLQILYLNVLTDVFPALALGVGKGHRDVLDRPPRPSDEGLLTKKIWAQISGWGFVISACVLFGLYYSLKGLGLEEPAAITVSVLTLGFAKLFFPFNLRDQDSGFFKNDITSNPWMWGAWALCIALLLAAVYLPGLSDILQTQDPGAAGWGLILGLALIPAVIGQIWIAVKKHMGNKPKG